MNDDMQAIVDELKKQIEEARKQEQADWATLALKIHAFEGDALEVGDETGELDFFEELHKLLQEVFRLWSLQSRQKKLNALRKNTPRAE